MSAPEGYKDMDAFPVILRKILGWLQWFGSGSDSPLGPSVDGAICSANITVGTSPVQCPTVRAKRGVYVSASPGNTGSIFVGGPNVGSGAMGIVLAKGVTSPLIPVNNLDQIFIHGSSASDTAGLLVV